ncbi:MAG: HD domain-containing protein [Candidatus Margulisbacteria bacterium]|nr:HD domain-containing protein [Candidatus Margulisiibacteriota bacterium]
MLRKIIACDENILALPYDKPLSPYAFDSAGAYRLLQEPSFVNNSLERVRPGLYPSLGDPFMDDLFRIRLSSSYIKLRGKSMSLSALADIPKDYISYRSDHVSDAALIGRIIGTHLKLNIALIEAIIAGHDIGHTPFGHGGERAIQKILDEFEVYDSTLREKRIKFFNHPAQSVRILNELKNKNEGINPTFQTLDGIMCHNKKNFQQIMTYKKDKTMGEFLAQYKNSLYIKGVLDNPEPMTLEGVVAKVADLISYIGKDIIDAIRINRITRQDIKEETIRYLIKLRKNEKIEEIPLDLINSRIIQNVLTDVIKNSKGKDHLEFSPEIYNALKVTREFILSFDPDMESGLQRKIDNIIRTLFIKYTDDLKNNNTESTIFTKFLKYKSIPYQKFTDPGRMAIDHIAGMTNDYLLKEFEEYTLP